MNEKLRAYLNAQKLTNYRFAKLHGFSPQLVGQWVNNKQTPGYWNTIKLNKIFNNN